MSVAKEPAMRRARTRGTLLAALTTLTAAAATGPEPVEAQTQADTLMVVAEVLRHLAGDSAVVLDEGSPAAVQAAMATLRPGVARLQTDPLCVENPTHVVRISLSPPSTRVLTAEESGALGADSNSTPASLIVPGFYLSSSAARVSVDFADCESPGIITDREGRQHLSYSSGRTYVLERRSGAWEIVRVEAGWIS